MSKSAILVISALLGLSAALSPPMPTFLWTGSEGLLAKNKIEATDLLSQSDVTNLVRYFVEETDKMPSGLASHFAAAPHSPEVVFVFLEPQMHTAQLTELAQAFRKDSNGGAVRNLKTSMDGAAASLTFPYTYKTESLALLEELEKVERVHVVDAEDAPAFMHDKQWMYRDHHTDVVVVRFKRVEESDDFASKIESDDRLLGQMVRKANQETKGDFLAVFTSNSPAPSSALAAAEAVAAQQTMVQTKAKAKSQSKSQSRSKANAKANDNANDDSDVVYMTPGLLSGLLVGLVLFMIASVGVTGLAALQTPDSWESEGGFLQGS